MLRRKVVCARRVAPAAGISAGNQPQLTPATAPTGRAHGTRCQRPHARRPGWPQPWPGPPHRRPWDCEQAAPEPRHTAERHRLQNPGCGAPPRGRSLSPTKTLWPRRRTASTRPSASMGRPPHAGDDVDELELATCPERTGRTKPGARALPGRPASGVRRRVLRCPTDRPCRIGIPYNGLESGPGRFIDEETPRLNHRCRCPVGQIWVRFGSERRDGEFSGAGGSPI
jgi:hypothetical protein